MSAEPNLSYPANVAIVPDGVIPVPPMTHEEVCNEMLPKWWLLFIQNISEIPDRTSPEDQPDAYVATREELEEAAMSAIEQLCN